MQQQYKFWLDVVRVAPATYLQHAIAWSAVFGLPIATGYFASEIASDNGSRNWLVSVFLALFIARAAFVVFSDRVEIILTHQIMAAYRKRFLMDACASPSRASFTRSRVGQMLASFQRDTFLIATFACASSVTLSRSVFLIVAFTWLVHLGVDVGLLAVAATIAGILIVRKLTAASVRISNGVEQEAGRDTNLLHSVVLSPGSIISSGVGPAFVELLDSSFRVRGRVALKLALASFAQQHVPLFFLSLPIAVMFLTGTSHSLAAGVLLAVTLLGFLAENFSKINRVAFLQAQAQEALRRLQSEWVEVPALASSLDRRLNVDHAQPLVLVPTDHIEAEDSFIAHLHTLEPSTGVLVANGRFGFDGSALDNLLIDEPETDLDLLFAWYRLLRFDHDFPGTDSAASAVAKLSITPYSTLSGGQVERLLCLRLLLRGDRRIAGWEPFIGVDRVTLHDVVIGLRDAGVSQVYVIGSGRIASP